MNNLSAMMFLSAVLAGFGSMPAPVYGRPWSYSRTVTPKALVKRRKKLAATSRRVNRGPKKRR